MLSSNIFCLCKESENRFLAESRIYFSEQEEICEKPECGVWSPLPTLKLVCQGRSHTAQEKILLPIKNN